MAPPVIDRARADLDRNELWRARQRLEGFVSSRGYQRDVVELLGDVCHRMGDVPNAGRYWFFTPVDSETKKNAIAVFISCYGKQPSQLFSQLPRRLRQYRESAFVPEVRERLQAIRKKTRHRSPMSAYRFTAGDRMIQVVGFAIMAFILLCFLLGLKQVIAILQKLF